MVRLTIQDVEYKNLEIFAKILKKRIEKDWDVVIAITGEEGSGKSNLAIQIGKRVDPEFSLERNELKTTNIEEIEQKLKNLRKGSVIIADEAIKMLYKREWMTSSQIFINKLYTLARKENKITILCIPRFSDLNEYFRNHRVKFWIHILSRGHAVVFTKDWNPFAKDPWWMDRNMKLILDETRGKKFAEIPLEKKLKILRKTKNFLLYLTFPDFSEEEYKAYKEFLRSIEIEEEQKEKESKKDKEHELRKKLAEIALKIFEKTKNFRKTADVVGLSPQVTRNLLYEFYGKEIKKIKEKKKKEKEKPKYSFLDRLRSIGIG